MTHKYGARSTTLFNITFPSEHEAWTYADLRQRAEAGEISDLRLQVPFVLQEAFVTADGEKRVRAIEYVADFTFVEDGKQVVVEAKGLATPVWKLKRKLFLKRFPEWELRVV